MELSVCIIAKNEEKMLPECLASIKSVASEIIVVDTGSTDRTVEIAESNGCRVIHFVWQEDFSQSRNLALEQARYPIILSLDADERIVNPHELEAFLRNPSPSTGGWLINLISKARRTDGGYDTYTGCLLRIFRNDPGIRYTGAIHEQIENSIIEKGYAIEETNIRAIHLGYDLPPEEMRQKHLKYLRMLELALLKEPSDGYNLFQKAKIELALNDLQKAEEDIVKSLQYLDSKKALKPQALNYAAVIAGRLGNPVVSNERALQSLKIIPNQAFAFFILGENFFQLKDYESSLLAYRQMAAAQETQDLNARISGDYYLPGEQLHFRIARCLLEMKQTDEAESEFRKGIDKNSDDVANLVGLANILFNKGNYYEAKEVLVKASAAAPGRDDIKSYMQMVESKLNLSGSRKSSFDSSAQLDSSVQYFTHSAIQKTNTGQIVKNNTDRPLISLSMIVKNEEKTLPVCLESVKDVVDEIVIVDTGSTDNTKAIAAGYGARIYDFKWINDFAAARNEALKRSTGEWILYLDADESLTKESISIFRDQLINADNSTGGFFCTIESKHLQPSGAVELHRGGYPRIFRNYGYPRIKFEGRAHEQIAPAIFNLGKNINFSDIVIIHTGYNRSLEDMDKKVRRNYSLLMEHIKEEPENAYAWYQLGQTLSQMGLREEAEKAIRFSIELNKLSGSVFASAAASLAHLTGNQKKFSEALYWANKSLEIAPEQVYAMNLKAHALLLLNRFQESEAAFLETLRRLRSKKGIPMTGFDVEVPESIILDGLRRARERRGS